MVMHLGIICAVQQINIWSCMVEKLKHPAGGGAETHPGAAAANLSKKSTSVGTKNQVESFLVILDSG